MDSSAETIINQIRMVPNPTQPELNEAESALKQMGSWLHEIGYRFAPVSMETREQVNRRPENFLARSIRDIFGWGRPFLSDTLPPQLLRCLVTAGALQRRGSAYASTIGFSNLSDASLLVHSAPSANDEDAVLLTPDTQRFVFWLENCLRGRTQTVGRILEINSGAAGAGIEVGRLFGASELMLIDPRPRAQSFARVNAALADRGAVFGTDLDGDCGEKFDLILAERAYPCPVEEVLCLIHEALPRLAPDGEIFLHVPSEIINGHDTLGARILPLLEGRGVGYAYREIDPDACTGALEHCRDIERIAMIGLRIMAYPWH